MFEDLREYIEWLQSFNKLHKINKKVSSDCEITEIVTRMIEKNGPTLLFENVDNNNIKVYRNLNNNIMENTVKLIFKPINSSTDISQVLSEIEDLYPLESYVPYMAHEDLQGTPSRIPNKIT